VEHSRDVTARLRDEEVLGLDEAICPACSLAFFVGSGSDSWGVCPDCLGAALQKIPADLLF